MDLSHLVSIGLFPAKRKPLSNSDLEYFRQHKVDQVLADLIDELAKSKPADPLKFISEKLSGGTPAPAKAAAAAPAKAKAAAAPADKAEAKAKAKAKATPTPAAAPAPAAAAPLSAEAEAEIQKVGDAIRELKGKLKAEGLSGKQLNEHPEIKSLVEKLQKLKADGPAEASAPKAAAAPAPAQAKPAKTEKKAEKPAKVAETAVAAKQPAKGGGMAIQKANDVPGWFEQVLQKAELIEQYPVKGCFILRPWSYRIWELIQGWLDAQIKDLGVENCYFPMFIPKKYLEKEKDHLADFAPELAMVTKFGENDIEEPVAIRPTSETAMYEAYSGWVQSHRDLPLKLNQWCSVVRWEVKQTTPFLRTREFLWQEGHTAYADKAGAEKEVLDVLELYAGVYEKLLALPVVRGTKTKAETFPGADYTTTVEAFIPATGRAIQGATSHHLGQNFSKMFEIKFQDPSDPSGKAITHAYQNSWGLTQRTIGVMTMVHGDDKGLVLPPRVACFQVVIVPVGLKAKSTEEERTSVTKATERYCKALQEGGVRVKLDNGDQTPGWKFNYWELKGIPLRIELGPNDIKKGEFVMAKRHILDQDAAKEIGKDATLVDDVKRVLESIQSEMYEKALAERDERLAFVDEWKEFSPNLNQGKLVLVPFCGEKECEEKIKEKSKEEAADAEVAGGLKMGAKSLCVPHEDKYNKACPKCCILPECEWNHNLMQRVLFGRSY